MEGIFDMDENEIKQIKENSNNAKQISYEELKNKLEFARNGANVHTVNKAIFYINCFLKNEEERYKYGKNYDRLSDLRYSIFMAIKYNEWKKLSEHMRSWF
jgi:hypothetical protein